MSTVRTCERLLLNTSEFIRRTLATVGEKKNIKNKRNLWESVVLTTEQDRQIQSFFLQYYGKKIPTKWHRLCTSYTGIFHYNYFPEILFSTKLEHITNPYREAEFLGDKNLLPILFGNALDVHVPKTYISSVKGVFRDTKMHVIPKEDVIKTIEAIGDCVLKKTKETSSGRDIEILHVDDNRNINDLLKTFGTDFVVQELIHQCKELSDLNHTSINTFRVITYLCDGNIEVCPIALRIGRSNSDRDNIHYGGICVGINADGTLKKTAFSEYGERFDCHPDTKVVFENYAIPGAALIIREQAKKLHSIIPWLGIISWDLTIDDEGRITIIEMNTTGQSAWFCQMVNGEPLFGENTGKMLEIIKSNK